MPFTRRILLAAAPAVAAARPPSPVVDCHLHCFAGRDNPKFPYHARGPYKPEKPATVESLLALMPGAGVDRAIVVQPEPYQDDHRYLEYCLAAGKGRLKGTALVFADQPASVKLLPDLVKRFGVVATRIHAYKADRLPPFGKPELRALWKLAAELGIAIQLHLEPRYAPGFTPLIREFTKTAVIVDHMGRPFQGTPEEHAVVVGWGKLPNTTIKLSVIPPPEQYPHREAGPIIRALTDAFGPDRCIYGGGFSETATAASYRAERERTRSFLGHLSSADQAKILGGNAMKLFGFTA